MFQHAQLIEYGLHLPETMPTAEIPPECLLPPLNVSEGTTEKERREAWLLRRQSSLGASDLPVLMGYSGWTSILTLWCQKKGLLPLDVDELEHQMMGHEMEYLIHRVMEKRFPNLLIKDPKAATIRHFLFPFLTASVDRMVFLKGYRRAKTILSPSWIPLECKNVTEYKDDEWRTHEVPQIYYAQVQAQMLVTGRQVAILAAVIGGNRTRVYTVRRDSRLIAEMIEVARLFWQQLEQNIRPTIDGSSSTTKTILALYSPEESTSPKVINEKVAGLIRQYQKIQTDEKSVMDRKDLIGNQIRDWMANDTRAEDPENGFSITFSGSAKPKLDTDKLSESEPGYKRLLKRMEELQARILLETPEYQVMLARRKELEEPFQKMVMSRTLRVNGPSSKWLAKKAKLQGQEDLPLAA